jgi:Tfp pilus assembly protein PilP
LLLAAALPVAAANKGTTGKPTQPKPTKPEEGFKDFAIITQRNVFNANRNAPAPPAAAPVRPPRPPTVEAFALLGTMSSERGAVAFFDGTSTAYRKAAEAGDKLGNYTITAIEHDRVTLKAGDSELCLPLKMQFRREGEGEWLLAELPDNFQPTAPPPGQVFQHRKSDSRKPDPRTLTPEQIRDYVMSKYDRKLAQLANDPEKSEKLLKALDREVEGRVKKLAKDLEKVERKLQQTVP